MSETSVIHFPGATIASPRAVSEIVDLLKEAIVKAEAGQIIGLSLVWVERQPLAFEFAHYATAGAKHSLAAGMLGALCRVGKSLSETDE